MGNNKNNFIYIKEKDGFLAEEIKTYYNKENNKLELLPFKTVNEMVNGLRLTSKQSKGIVKKLDEYSYTTVIINPFAQGNVYELHFPLHDNLTLDFSHFGSQLSIDKLSRIETDPSNHTSDDSTFYFRDKDLMRQFLLRRLDYVKEYNLTTTDKSYNDILETLSIDKNFSYLMRDYMIDKILED